MATAAAHDAIKETAIALDDQQLATAQARPTAPLEAWPTMPPDPTVDVSRFGISRNCLDAHVARLLQPTNCWYSIVLNHEYHGYAGARLEDASQGVIVLWGHDLTTRELMENTYYDTPTRMGPVTFSQAIGSQLVLTTDDNELFVFNVETKRWDDLASIPATTLTPAPTPRPQ